MDVPEWHGECDVTEWPIVALQSIKALYAAMEGKLDKSANGADIPNKKQFVDNLSLGEKADKSWVSTNGAGYILHTINPPSIGELTSWIRSLPGGGHAFRFSDNSGGMSYNWSCGYITRAGDTWAGMVAHYNYGVAIIHGNDSGGDTGISRLWTDKNAIAGNDGVLRKSFPPSSKFPPMANSSPTTNQKGPRLLNSAPVTIR
ncbi:hypothetical protein [Xenorhabdus lircayensis]|uniref:hypothetical protein n=1 Tax=Xenorhabdus lircayensis TaxID=2763499 RepID=UPI001E4987BA|nr:hypothetical protein [Xenorhabdus lircayensis]